MPDRNNEICVDCIKRFYCPFNALVHRKECGLYEPDAERKWDCMFESGFVQNGWQCPVCGRVMAPTMMWCPWCADKETNTCSNLTIHTDGTVVRDYMVNPCKGKEENHAAD